MVSQDRKRHPPAPSRWRILIKGRLYEIEAIWATMSVNNVITFRDANDNIVRAVKDWDDLWMVDSPYGKLIEVP